jgi:hypothetical protein
VYILFTYHVYIGIFATKQFFAEIGIAQVLNLVKTGKLKKRVYLQILRLG